MMASAARFRRPRFFVALGICGMLLGLGVFLVLLGGLSVLRAVGVALIIGAWTLPVLYAVKFRARAEFKKIASSEDVRSSQRAVINGVTKAHQGLSTSLNRQDRALQRIEERLRSLTAESQSRTFTIDEADIDVLFVTSNGAGLGHISRMMAIARELPGKRSAELLTLSTAYRNVGGQGMTVHYFPSSEASGQDPRRWNRHFRAHLNRLMESSLPRLVVFDGTWVYSALAEVCRAKGIPLVWVQRGMWREEVDLASTQRHHAATVADYVIVPGDYAGEERVDSGPRITPVYTGPVVMTTKDELLDRESACAALNLDAGRKYVLLNLGGGDISDPTTLAHSFRHLLAEMAPELVPVQVISPLSPRPETVPGVERIRAYPVMKYVRAFEFTVCAAGYNSSQEAVSLGIPAIMVPNRMTRTDDQVRRTRQLAAQELCFNAEDEAGQRQALAQMLDLEQRAALQQRLDALSEPRGAQEAASFLESLIEQAGWIQRAETLEGSPTNGA